MNAMVMELKYMSRPYFHLAVVALLRSAGTMRPLLSCI